MKSMPASLRWILGIILTLTLLFFVWFIAFSAAEKWDWESELADYQSHGESLDAATLTPAPIPDDQNYAAIPFLRDITIPDSENLTSTVPHPTRILLNEFLPQLGGWFDHELEGFTSNPKLDLHAWVQNLPREVPIPHRTPDPFAPDATAEVHALYILEILDSKFGPFFAQSDAAATRPLSQFIPHQLGYDDLPQNTQIDPMGRFSQLLRIRASAALHSGDPKTATLSILAILKLLQAEQTPSAEAYASEANLHLLGACSALREAVAGHNFDPASLARLQDEFAGIDRLASHSIALRLGVIEYLTWIDDIKKYGFNDFGRGKDHIFLEFWVDQNRAIFLHEAYHSIIVPIDAQDFASYRKKVSLLSDNLRKKSTGPLGYRWLPAKTHIGFLTGSAPFYAQAIAHQAQLACALERHHLKHHSYPTALADLIPEFIQRVPEDPIDRQPMRYRKTPDGHYLLHSIGLNQKDEKGATYSKSPSGDDWPWSPVEMLKSQK